MLDRRVLGYSWVWLSNVLGNSGGLGCFRQPRSDDQHPQNPVGTFQGSHSHGKGSCMLKTLRQSYVLVFLKYPKPCDPKVPSSAP